MRRSPRKGPPHRESDPRRNDYHGWPISNPRGFRLARTSTVLGLLALTLAGAALALLAAPAAALPPASGDWVVTGSETYTNQTIVIEGNVFVRAPANLSLFNVTLEINSTSAARRGLLVEPGAIFRTGDMDNATGTSADRTVIRPLNPAERIWFVAAPGSTLDLRQTAMWGVGYTQSPANHSGVYIQTNLSQLNDISVYASYFGIVITGANRTYAGVTVHNNTYNGIDITGNSRITINGLVANDNNGTGFHAASGTHLITGASILHNGDGVAAKFGTTITISSFDISGNGNGVVALNDGHVVLLQGRVTNNTAAGADARQSSSVNATQAVFADNPTGMFASLTSTVAVNQVTVLRGIRAFQLRSGAAADLQFVRIDSASGDGLDMDLASATLLYCTLESNAFGGAISGSTNFAMLDSSLLNSTAGGFTFVNSTGVYLHNPIFVNNRGRSVDLQGNSTSLIDATALALFDRTVVDVRALSISGTLAIVSSTLHATAALGWSVTGTFNATNASIVGDVPGASLTLQGGAGADIRGLSVADFDLRFSGAAAGASVDGLAQSSSGELALTSGSSTWRNVTQTGVSGRVRAASGTLLIVGGSISSLRAEDGGTIDLTDVSASVGGAAYAGSGMVRQWWTTSIRTEWRAGVVAAGEAYSVADAASSVIASGTTNAGGIADLGAVLALRGTSGGLVSLTPHTVSAGSGAWATNASINVDQAATYAIDLQDLLPPSLTIQAPTAGAAVTGTTVIVSGTAADGESGMADIGWSFDNVTFTPGLIGALYSLSVPTTFETTYLVTVRLRDFEGNAAFASVSFRADRTAPFISLTQPTNGSSLRGPVVRFAGATEVGATLTVNGSLMAVDAQGDFDGNVTLPEGLAVVGLTAVDAAGNVFFMEVTLRLDSSSPGIAVFSPPNGSTVSVITIDLVGLIEPGASLSIDGVAQLALSNGSFNVSVDLLTEGANNITLRSVDGAGNANQTVWVVFRDTRAPVISIAGLTGSGPWALNDSTPEFNITTDEYAFIEASTSPGGAQTSASGLALLFTPALSEANFTLTVRATDAGGNRVTRTYALRIDITAPTFALDNRTESGFVNGASWTVSLSAEAGATVTVGGVAATPTGLGASTYTATVALQPGPNTITITVVDAAGNRATRVLSLTLDQQAPTVTITGPAQGASTASGQIEVSGDTEAGARVTVNGREVPTDNGRFATLVNIPVGATTITVAATDAAGNTGSATRQVTRTTGGGVGTGFPFLEQNVFAILLLLLVATVGAGLAARGRAKRAGLKDKSASLERDLQASRAARNDMNALENFSPRSVKDEDFVSAEEFRRRESEGAAAPPKKK